MPTVSLTMIVRDEEANLPGCLASCAGLFDELIIVDTGSTDRTKEIAADHTDKHGSPARVFDFPWCDDFAAARNESLRHATGDWVFLMDADDRLDARSQVALKTFLSEIGGNGEFALMLMSLSENGQLSQPSPQMRLFSRHPQRQWSGRIHEVLSPICGTKIVQIPVQHLGYKSRELWQAKSARNMRLLELELAERPERTELLYYFGREHSANEDFAKALDCFERCKIRLDARRERPSYYETLLLVTGYCYGYFCRWEDLARIESDLQGCPNGRPLIENLRRLFPLSRGGSMWTNLVIVA